MPEIPNKGQRDKTGVSDFVRLANNECKRTPMQEINARVFIPTKGIIYAER